MGPVGSYKTWFVIPSKRPREQAQPVLDMWKQQGYGVALLCDIVHDAPEGMDAVFRGKYPGYSKAVNFLTGWILANDPTAQWIVTGGDDIEPDKRYTADLIADQCTEHFNGTYGVMQPIGDKWECDITRICACPWMGREFCRRINGGKGPMWPEYFHMFNDEEMQEVVIKLGIFWQRDDVSQYHHHWMRRGDVTCSSNVMPTFLERASSRDNWDKMKAIFTDRKSKGFPGHEPLPA